MIEGKNGVTESTPKNILFGAGTYHKNLKFSNNAWNFEASLIGATKGGGKFKIEPVLEDIEPDGALVKVKGLTRKNGEKCSMELNLIELTKDMILASTLGTTGTSDVTGYDLIESKSDIVEGDYVDNIAFVGKNGEGKNIIVIMDNALCTSGLEAEGKNKDASVGKYVFECYADIDSDLDKLPYHIYFPSASN